MITKTKARRSDISDFYRIPRSSFFNKQILIKMAKNGDDRPSQKTRLGRVLSEYTKKSSCCFDVVFYNTIKKLRPDWFVSQTEKADKKKQELIRMAKNGEPRPSHDRTRIGQALSNYTRKSSHVYDSIFDKLIRKLRPDWF